MILHERRRGKLPSYIAYFDRMGCDDWIIQVRGKRLRFTKHIEWYMSCPKTIIRKHQPRAVLRGRGLIVYTRALTRIYGCFSRKANDRR